VGCVKSSVLYSSNPYFLIYLQKHFMIRIGAHLAIGLVFGFLYRGVGAKADSVFANYVYLYGTILFLVYTGKMAVTLSCKLCLAYQSSWGAITIHSSTY
jgi:hypothetical protein